MKIYKVEINGRTFDITQDTDGKFIRPEINGGSALKPANEPICLARKPLSEKTIVDNVIKWGTGGINVDGCRIDYKDDNDKSKATPGGVVSYTSESWGQQQGLEKEQQEHREANEGGRFPANILFDEEAAQVLDKQSGISGGGTKSKSGFRVGGNGENSVGLNGTKDAPDNYGDKGGASRFFYVAKVGKKERNLGLDNFEEVEPQSLQFAKDGSFKENKTSKSGIQVRLPRRNNHPTLKPINLMTYLCRLITPPGGIVLDPFMGSGSTGISACLEGFRFVGMELDEDYFKIAEARVNSFEEYRKLLK